MYELEKQNLLKDLNDLNERLINYKKRQEKHAKMKFTEGQKKALDALRLRLRRDYRWLKKPISEYGDDASIKILGIDWDAFVYSLRSLYMDPSQFTALDKAINLVTTAVAKIESMPVVSADWRDMSITEVPKKNGKETSSILDTMQLHPKIIEASRSCFVAGNYREAILNAFISLIDYVKEMTGLDLDGDDLMNQVFSFNYDKKQRRITKYPIIRINELKNKSDRNEQQGFMFLCKGAAGGIRNPKAHKLIPQSNPLHTLEYLAFASLLTRRIEEGKVVKPLE